jgi:(p)ppGpp synthase/HD superfamily hydrolase
MQKYTSLDDMIELARFAHRNQRDKAGMPYFEHPYRVMQAVQQQGGLPYMQMGAILHDVSEDTAFSTDVLRTLGVPDAALEIVRLLDRSASETVYRNRLRAGMLVTMPLMEADTYHADRDEFYYTHIKNNPGALMVKLADIHDNTQEWRLSYLPKETQDRLRKKYDKAKAILLG